MQPPQSLHLGLPSRSSPCAPVALSLAAAVALVTIATSNSVLCMPGYLPTLLGHKQTESRFSSTLLSVFCSVFSVSPSHCFPGTTVLPGDVSTTAVPSLASGRAPCPILCPGSPHTVVHVGHCTTLLCHSHRPWWERGPCVPQWPCLCTRPLKNFTDPGYSDFWRSHSTKKIYILKDTHIPQLVWFLAVKYYEKNFIIWLLKLFGYKQLIYVWLWFSAVILDLRRERIKSAIWNVKQPWWI